MITTSSEFNFKYRDYLENGHYGLSIDNSKVITYLDNIFQDLIRIPDFKFTQIKLKFGDCRFYSNLKSTSLQNQIEDHITELCKEKIKETQTL